MYAPTDLLFGAGTLSQLGDRRLPGTRALVVTTNGRSVMANGYLDRLKRELDRADVSTVLFNQIEPNPLRSTVNAGALLAYAERCDFVVALGGGSAMDAGKAIAAAAANVAVGAAGEPSVDIWDYVKGGTAKGLPIPVDPLPLVCIPTTAGTGSEVDSGGIVSCRETNEKLRLNDPRLFPVLAVVDPELMATVPPRLTAYQGFDALFHNIECFISAVATPLGDLICREGVRSATRALPRAVADGSDMEARTQMAWASTLGGYAMDASGTTGSHALEHAMSAYHHDLPHGAGLIMISLAYHRAMIRAHACDDRYVELARLLGDAEASAPEDFLPALERLERACGVADLKMSDWGIDQAEFDDIAGNALATTQVLFDHDPAPLSHDDVVGILRESYR